VADRVGLYTWFPTADIVMPSPQSLVTPHACSEPGGAMNRQLDDEGSAVAPARRRTPFDVHVDPHRVAKVSGELDVNTAPRFAAELYTLVDDGGAVCVDFSKLVFCGAAGINVLVGAVRTLGDRGRLVIYNPSPMVARLIETTGLDALVDIAVGRVVNAPHPPRTIGARLDSARRTVTTGRGLQTDECRLTTAEAG
jgi:anti-anti-sigma factor